jgi:hypothetical protein
LPPPPPRVIFVTFLFSSVSESLTPHCKDTVQYHKFEKTFPDMKLRGLVPISCINVSVSDLYIPRIGLPILLQKIGGPMFGIYKLLKLLMDT